MKSYKRTVICSILINIAMLLTVASSAAKLKDAQSVILRLQAANASALQAETEREKIVRGGGKSG